jgi:hypothetical protein
VRESRSVALTDRTTGSGLPNRRAAWALKGDGSLGRCRKHRLFGTQLQVLSTPSANGNNGFKHRYGLAREAIKQVVLGKKKPAEEAKKGRA